MKQDIKRIHGWTCLLLITLVLVFSSAHASTPAQTPAETKPASDNDQKPLAISSKLFTESVILGEILTRMAQDVHQTVHHQRELGGTRIVWNALVNGEIDAYVDYSGTLEQEILRSQHSLTHEQLQQAVKQFGVRLGDPLGFNNTYAMGVRQSVSEQLGLSRISQLSEHPELKFGFGLEFMDRADGWPGLKRFYQLPQTDVTGLEHELAYRALESGDIHMTELYSTDAEIAYYNLIALEDDRDFFPRYEAMIVYRADLIQRFPKVIQQWQRLAGKIDANSMSRMNAEVKLQGLSEAQVAESFLVTALGFAKTTQSESASAWAKAAQHMLQRTLEHLQLVSISLGLALFIALPLGIFAARRPTLGRVILSTCSILQTIPSLAVFVFLIPLLGIGSAPAIAALFIYSLLPIVRNTHAGLTQIPAPLMDSARTLGLSPAYRLRRIELPLAMPTILAGIQTAAVINVGTATLAALIGAGGYGQPILTGIRLDDFSLIMQGAAPAAVLALTVQALFSLLEKRLTPEA